jgi:hypothetical protein
VRVRKGPTDVEIHDTVLIAAASACSTATSTDLGALRRSISPATASVREWWLNTDTRADSQADAM